MRYQTCERGSGILRQWAIAALTAAGALAFVLVPTWARDRYAAPSAGPAKVFGSRRAEKTLPALPVTTPHYFHHVYRSVFMASQLNADRFGSATPFLEKLQHFRGSSTPKPKNRLEVSVHLP